MMSRVTLLLIGIVFHVVYLFSIFDIYFTSPLVHGMTPHKSPLAPPADRLFLIVGDGLRADKLFELEDGTTRAPFLRKIIEEQGAWGVSHTRVPTESRPGHVAIIAGFYEDVSAVTTGWTMNPVNYDSLFNESQHTWSFGSPDILPMFQHGASDPNRIETFMYPPEFEDFSEEASHLDTWVFDHVKALFRNATSSPELNRQLRQKKIVFFLHLLGLDTNGHGFRPHSKEYHNNIRLVDAGIADLVEMVEEFYGHDGRTSYVFTADHGMNNRGAHGDGHPDNTRTPIVAWGAGIRQPLYTGLNHDEFSAPWGLDRVQRDDIKQADIAPLMASLIGVPFPVNSVGELPLTFLKADEYYKAQAAFTNARQILAQYQVKNDEKAASELFFRPFPPLSGDHSPEAFMANIQSLIDAKDYAEAERMSKELIDLSLRGLRYFQTYDWFFLRSIITLGYVGWCIFCLEYVLRHYVLGEQTTAPADGFGKLDAIGLAIFGLIASMIVYQKMPLIYHAYVLFPVFFWNQVLRNRASLVNALGSVRHFGAQKLGLLIFGTLFCMEALVYSFFQREVLSVLFLLLTAWPVVAAEHMQKESRSLRLGWALSCLCTSIFTLLPVEKGEDIFMVLCGGCLGLMLSGYATLVLRRAGRITPMQTTIALAQMTTIAVSMVLVYSTSTSLANRQGLPLINQILSLAIVAISSVFPFIYRGPAETDYFTRLLIICQTFFPLMIILSISYEALFYVCFCTTVLLWLQMERALYRPLQDIKTRPLQASDGRIVVMFLFFINVAFFGTGNIASLSSFSLASVYRLITVFNPFIMGALLIIKVLVPFFVVSAVLGIMGASLDLPSFALFLVVLSITDVQTINFFYFVSDFGSWLEIGTGISHFCIAELFIIFTILLFLLSRLLVGHLHLAKRKFD
ncbi:Phosphatidylinositolglycan class N-domain-containing protein [Radiomyces spectabilis]|uniref:Phosphatidylinositolglycan class N-domain-containing protein n=1 Tax=Radiomyces spectabilis TaxID=64574 RepID=UPI00221E8631|nr:Phosphatidylinositolglycan class N-domain-containing protein [Radiomyces spectabilis]KAI8379184.1 Phosphatidylinositolglycan class N-domain-containing protein [Radiomyces spectabilis]